MKIINFNNDWVFSKENKSKYRDEEITGGESITLPHSWNAEDGQGNGEGLFKGECWYQRNLNLDSEDLKKYIFLEIGAAGNVSEVYINGKVAGSSKCGYAMYRVSLTPFLKEGDNLISILVDNSQHEDVYPLMADFTFYGGLYRDVKLIFGDALHFDLLDNGRDGVYLTQRHLDKKTFELNIKGRIINEFSSVSKGKLKLDLYNQENNKIFAKSISIEVCDKFEFNISEKISELTLWQGVENPYLYILKADILIDREICDSRSIEIGFRDIQITPDEGLFLNGKHIKLKGVSRHQDFAGVGNALSREHMELDMSLIKEIGANSVRLAHYQHDDYFYTLCDREGLLVWAEIPFISVPSTVDENNQNAKDQLERLIKQAYNHSSIYCWGVQNEITIAVENESIYEKVEELESMAKDLDPGRYTAQANIHSVRDESPLNQITDLLGYNLYYGWYYKEMQDLAKRLDTLHKARPGIPVLISEYGVDTNPQYHSYNPTVRDYTEEYQLLFHENAIKTIKERPFVLGGYMWNMFDFGSDNREEGGVQGLNIKGLVTIDRKLKKDAFYLYKAYWSNSPFVHLAGRRFANRHKKSNDIVILSNLNDIKLFVGEEIVDHFTNNKALKVVKGVKLSPGENLLRVEGYDEDGNIYSDEMILNLVDEKDQNYIVEKNEEDENAFNWFEKFDLSNVQEVTLKEGYYSTFDIIRDIYENEEAKAVFMKYFADISKHPRFQAMIDVSTINAMSKISQLNIPKELLTVINRELNSIPKND